jgi:3-dehydroquinate synthase
VIVTDENIMAAHGKKLRNWQTIVIQPGEAFKVQSTVNTIVLELIRLGVDRSFTLVGLGGGVITDLTGYVASIYMRGISFGFVPTTLLAMVDASIGGKNGVDVGPYKNMVGVIRQPRFILFDTNLLKSLPSREWVNGFAEIIKHAAIRDVTMFRELEKNSLTFYRSKKKALDELVQRNALLKTKIVQSDEFEKGDRKLLNFGHTLGHAIETGYQLQHGVAISYGMNYAAELSRIVLRFKETDRLSALLEKYDLPTKMKIDPKKVMEILKMDKKKDGDAVNFILLKKIGKAVIQPIPFKKLYDTLL